jgi:VWFA-related protein
MRRATTISSVTLLLLALAGSLAAQEFQLQVQVNEVIVPFSVRDDDGKLVAGLTVDDFTVLEDGKVQTVSDFSDFPVALSVALVIDTGLKNESLEAIKASIPALVASFSDFDEMAVYRYDNAVFKVLDFIEDKEALRDALNGLTDLGTSIQIVGGDRSQPSNTINGLPTVNATTSALDRDRRVLHDALYQAGRDLRGRAPDRRSVIMVISDGTAERNEIDIEEVQQSLIETGFEIQVYPIGLNVEVFVRLTDSLDGYAELTGGKLFYVDGDSLEATYSEITGQARNQYLLTYVSNNPIPPNTIPFREIEIRGGRDYDIDHRGGYYQVP